MKVLSLEEAEKLFPRPGEEPEKPTSRRHPLDAIPMLQEYRVSYLNILNTAVPRHVLERAVEVLRVKGRHFRKASQAEAEEYLEGLASRIRWRKRYDLPSDLAPEETAKAAEMMGVYFACLVVAGMAGKIMKENKDLKG